MSNTRWTPERVLIYRHPVDMRKQIDALSELVASELGHNPADRTAYVFISRCSRRIKVLIWHLNGYWLLYKRVETQRFHWPDWFAENETIQLDQAQLDYLLDGYDLNGMRPHNEPVYARHF